MDIFKKEKVFHSKREIKYILDEKESEFLVILFSGYSNHPKMKHLYNYIVSTNETNVNRLFILDNFGYDSRGCWYLGENNSDDVEESVINLINKTLNDLKIDKNKVILAGTSKGGFASIYYGTKYKFKYVVSGAPQIYLSNYLEEKKNILDGILGENYECTDLNRLNNKISELYNNETEYYIYCGKEDSHYENHVKPFVENSIEKNIYLEIIEGTHNELGVYFSKILPKTIDNIMNNNNSAIKKYNSRDKVSGKINLDSLSDYDLKELISVNYEDKKIRINIALINLDYQYACYLFKDNNPVIKTMYSKRSEYIYNLKEFGDYSIRCFFKCDGSKARIIDIPLKISISKDC